MIKENSEEKKEIKADPALEDVKADLEKSETLKNEYLAGWQRARADLLNYKKDEIERISELMKYSNEEFILKILPILDNFQLAESAIPEQLINDDYVKGLLQVKSQLADFLKGQGVEEIKSMGEKLDLNFHEVVDEVDSKDKEPGTVVEEIEKGYKICGRLLRVAKVRVSK